MLKYTESCLTQTKITCRLINFCPYNLTKSVYEKWKMYKITTGTASFPFKYNLYYLKITTQWNCLLCSFIRVTRHSFHSLLKNKWLRQAWKASVTILPNIHTDIHMSASHEEKKCLMLYWCFIPRKVPLKSKDTLARMWEFDSEPELALSET